VLQKRGDVAYSEYDGEKANLLTSEKQAEDQARDQAITSGVVMSAGILTGHALTSTLAGAQFGYDIANYSEIEAQNDRKQQDRT
jgi:hypothetical protein